MAPVLRHCPCLRPESDDVKVLEYSHSNLEDVPNDVFSYERTLEELYLDANQIKDLPRPLFHCHGLKKLNLSDNEIHSLPPAIASLINLEQLDVSKNGITEIPDNIKGCKCLSLVDASVNPLEKLPEGFTQLINLQELYLNDTFLEYLPANFGRLSKLRILELRENHLKVLPKSMARLTELSRLDIGQNDFSDLPEVIGNLPRLVELWCDCNNISCLPPFLGGLKKLSYLDASKNRIYDVAEEIEGCSSLCDLTLSSNRIKELPEGIVNLRKLSVLRVDSNRLVCLPMNIGNLISMEEMVLSSNDLSRIPYTIGLMRNLKTLIADDNLLEELPCEMGSCQKLTILSLRDNKLMFIPDELGHISALKVINLSKNLLQCLPFSIAKLPNLQALWLSENQNKPLVPLQSDIDRMTGQKVLTCFMLPQVPLDEDIPPHECENKEAEMAITEGKGRQLIKFAFDLEKDRPSKLVRAPTPYPKELKAHARHAKNYALKKLGGKDSEVLDMRNQSGTVMMNHKRAPPDIMVMPLGANQDCRAKGVKEAVVTSRKSPPPSPNSKRNTNKDPKVNPQSSIESSGSDVPVKTLGRRDSRGDGSSSENASSSPVGSPKTASSAQGQNHLAICGYQKNTAGKKDAWMCQRMIRQGSGDSDRGYRSDHEVYLSERDQYGVYSAHSDGYASDWEAFLSKQNTYTPANPHQYAVGQQQQQQQQSVGNSLGYRGNAEGQEIEGNAEGAYWQGTQYMNNEKTALTEQQYQEMGAAQQAYWASVDPSLQQYYPPYDQSQPYQTAPMENPGYHYQPNEAQIQTMEFYQQAAFSPSDVYGQRPPAVVQGSRTLPRRFIGTSPRLKRAQCISVQAPLHGTPQEYHLMPQAHGNLRPVSPGATPRAGQSTSPRMESMFTYPTMRSMSQNPHMQYHTGPITSQPTNAIQFPSPSTIHSYYGNYTDAPPTAYPLPPSPRLKHTANQPYGAAPMEDSVQQARVYNTMVNPPNPNAGCYTTTMVRNPQASYQDNVDHTMKSEMNPYDTRNSPMMQEQYRTMAMEATVGAATLQYRTNSIPVEMQSLEHGCDGSPPANIQHLNRSVPCINIIPSGSPPQHSYLMTAAVDPQSANPNEWKETSVSTDQTNTSSKIPSDIAEIASEKNEFENYQTSAGMIRASPNSIDVNKKADDNVLNDKQSPNLQNPGKQATEESIARVAQPSGDGKGIVHKQGVYKAMPISNMKVIAAQSNDHALPNVPKDSMKSSIEKVKSEADYENIESVQYHDYQNIPQNVYERNRMILESRNATASKMSESVNIPASTSPKTKVRQPPNKQDVVSKMTNSSSSVTPDQVTTPHREQEPSMPEQVENKSCTMSGKFQHTNIQDNGPNIVPINSSNNQFTLYREQISNMAEPSVTGNVQASSGMTSSAPTTSQMQELNNVEECNNSVMAIAEAINKRENTTQQPPRVASKPKVEDGSTSKGGYAISSLDEVCDKVPKSSKLNSSLATKTTKSSPSCQDNSRVEECVKNTSQPHQQITSQLQQFVQHSHLQHNVPPNLNDRKNAQKQPMDSNTSNEDKGMTSNKRFQKVLPPIDKSHHLKPTNLDNTGNTPSSNAVNDNIKVANMNEIILSAERVESVVPNKSSTSLKMHNTQEVNSSSHAKIQPAVPPKPHTNVGDPNASIHSKSTSTKIASVTQHLINCINKNVANEPQKVAKNENIPDLITRTENQSNELILCNDKKADTIISMERVNKVLNNKVDQPGNNVSADYEENHLSGAGVTVLESPKSPKRNLWFLGTHKNTLVFPVVIVKNPSLGFTIEGGAGKPRCPTRPHDNGIYVAHVASDGPANGALRPGDKILQANGVDFSCLHIDKAASFLNSKEATLSLMVSRE